MSLIISGDSDEHGPNPPVLIFHQNGTAVFVAAEAVPAGSILTYANNGLAQAACAQISGPREIVDCALSNNANGRAQIAVNSRTKHPGKP